MSKVERLIAEAIDRLEKARSTDFGEFETQLTESIDQLEKLHTEVYDRDQAES